MITPNEPAPPTNVAQPAPAQMSRLVKFHLPTFTANDPDTWFSAVEHIFRVNQVTSEDEKFSMLLQCLDPTQLGYIKDILGENSPNKFTAAKERLVQIHGRSLTEQIQKMLKQVESSYDKPSVILTKMKNIVGSNQNTELLKSIWIQKLPPRTAEILAINPDLTLDQQAKTADRLHDHNTSHVQPQVYAVASKPVESNMPQLLDMISKLTTQVASLQQQMDAQTNHHSRERRPNYSRNRSRSRSKPELTNGICWYHTTFKTQAFKCVPGCNFSRNSEN